MGNPDVPSYRNTRRRLRWRKWLLIGLSLIAFYIGSFVALARTYYGIYSVSRLDAPPRPAPVPLFGSTSDARNRLFKTVYRPIIYVLERTGTARFMDDVRGMESFDRPFIGRYVRD
ncbi:MAG TPA: hypothetical protein VEA69_05175 [Tepidisphaeraceae bacterium]|nr:hypothetical protein [Tepidisphaeraceae bacterium]